MEHESDGDTIGIWCTWSGHQGIVTGSGGLGDKRTSGVNPLLRLARLQGTLLETWSKLLSLRLQWKTICHSWREKLLNKSNNNKNKCSFRRVSARFSYFFLYKQGIY